MTGKVSWHHNVPSSCGGTNHKRNLSSPQHARHDLLHAWAANYTPGTILRLLAVHANRFPERALPPGALRDILGMLTEGELDSLYHAGVVLPSPQAGEKHILRHLRHEANDVRGMISFLADGHMFVSKREFFLDRALAFFQAKTSHEAMLGLLRESYGRDLSWAKALRDDVRSGLSAILVSAAPSLVPEQQRVVDVLQEQEHRIAQKIAALLVRNPSLPVGDNV